MIRVLVVDDEELARERLRRMLGEHAAVEVVGEAADGLEAIERVEDLRPDAVFLDIDMPRLGGLEVARALGPGGPTVIFLTAYSQYALEAFERAAADYLLKPVSALRLASTLDRLKARRGAARALGTSTIAGAAAPAMIPIKAGTRYLLVPVEEVSALVASEHHVRLHTAQAAYDSERSLDSFEARLPEARYLRVHRGALVRVDAIQALRRVGDRQYVASLRVPEGLELPVSRHRLDEVRRRLGLAT